MRNLLISIFIILFSFSANASLFGGLPSDIRKALEDAHATGNKFVVEAVIKYTKDNYPAYDSKIDGYMATIEQAKLEEKKAKQTKEMADKSPFSGNVDAAINVANGNTKSQNLNASTTLNYEAVDWSNVLKITTRASEENRTRTNEEYIINNQSKYHISDEDYAFLELEYVNDRFSGYQYRTQQLLGYGYRFVTLDHIKVSGEASIGARQSHKTDNAKDNSLLGKIGAKATWNITDKVTFDQDLHSSIGSDAVITVWDSALKTKIVDSIYLKLNYNLQHIDDVADDKNHYDSLTTLGVGYEF